MSLAIATDSAPDGWLRTFEEDPRLIATAVELLEDRQRRSRGRKR